MSRPLAQLPDSAEGLDDISLDIRFRTCRPVPRGNPLLEELESPRALNLDLPIWALVITFERNITSEKVPIDILREHFVENSDETLKAEESGPQSRRKLSRPILVEGLTE
jgi:hypothetical protein